MMFAAALLRIFSFIYFGSFLKEEEEKTIEYRFFDDVTKKRSMPSRV